MSTPAGGSLPCSDSSTVLCIVDRAEAQLNQTMKNNRNPFLQSAKYLVMRYVGTYQSLLKSVTEREGKAPGARVFYPSLAAVLAPQASAAGIPAFLVLHSGSGRQTDRISQQRNQPVKKKNHTECLGGFCRIEPSWHPIKTGCKETVSLHRRELKGASFRGELQ